MILLKFGGITMPKNKEEKLLEEDEEDPEVDPEDPDSGTIPDDDEF